MLKSIIKYHSDRFFNQSKSSLWRFRNIVYLLIYLSLVIISSVHYKIHPELYSSHGFLHSSFDESLAFFAFFSGALITVYAFIIPPIFNLLKKAGDKNKVRMIEVVTHDHIIRFYVFVFPIITGVVFIKLSLFGLGGYDIIPLLLLSLHSLYLLVTFVIYYFVISSDIVEFLWSIQERIALEHDRK